jgi:ppGpp synthetase/RelA/SpoT-type nucleotidyltranferase
MTDEALTDDTGDVINAEQLAIEQSAREARNSYESVRGLYGAFARKLAGVLEECIAERNITVHSVTHRAKDPEHFERKAAQPSPDNPTVAKYPNPMDDITDKASVRVITYFRSTVDAVSKIVMEQLLCG